jgi:penicillin-binding protein 1B
MKRKILLSFSAILILALIGFSWLVLGLAQKVEKGFILLKEAQPSQVFSDTLRLEKGQKIEIEKLKSYLDWLGYRQTERLPQVPGEFQLEQHARGGARFRIFQRPHELPYDPSLDPHEDVQLLYQRLRRVPSHKVSILLENSQIIELSVDQSQVEKHFLEPIALATLADRHFPIRSFVSLSEIPTPLVQGVIAVEDPRFLRHQGIDPKGIARAFWVNLTRMQLAQGGSTLTQQLARNMFLTNKKTLTRKFKEAIIALILEFRYSKDQIIERYLNEVYFGQLGNAPILGVKEAARYYFSKSLEDLKLSEVAFLAGIIRGPFYYHPIKHEERALERRNFVLEKMLEHKILSEAEFEEAQSKSLGVTLKRIASGKMAPYFVDAVADRAQEILKNFLSEDAFAHKGYKIYSTLNPLLQESAEKILKKESQKIGARAKTENRLEASLIAVDPKTGFVKALLGGRNYRKSNFNRILYGKRQPGSTFKPFVYLTAFGNKDKEGRPYYPGRLISDQPFEHRLRTGKIWSPKNYDNQGYQEKVTLREALYESRNVATSRLALEIGIPSITRRIQSLGVKSEIPELPSIALGAVEMSAIELAQAYSTVANLGEKIPLRMIRALVDHRSQGIPLDLRPPEQIDDPSTYALLIHSMKSVFEKGTARSARRRGFSAPAAGKTGTTNDHRDSWFVGFNPNLLAITWVGFDEVSKDHEDLDKLKLTGANAALQIWTPFFKEATDQMSLEDRDWNLLKPRKTKRTQDSPFSLHLGDEEKSLPPLLKSIRLDPDTGLRYRPSCGPEFLEEVVIPGREPRETCLEKEFH